MIKNFILIALAIIGVAAILYFGWDWIQPGITYLIDQIKGLFHQGPETTEQVSMLFAMIG